MIQHRCWLRVQCRATDLRTPNSEPAPAQARNTAVDRSCGRRTSSAGTTSTRPNRPRDDVVDHDQPSVECCVVSLSPLTRHFASGSSAWSTPVRQVVGMSRDVIDASVSVETSSPCRARGPKHALTSRGGAGLRRGVVATIGSIRDGASQGVVETRRLHPDEPRLGATVPSRHRARPDRTWNSARRLHVFPASEDSVHEALPGGRPRASRQTVCRRRSVRSCSDSPR